MAMSNVVLTDGQGTPVNHTFTPQNGQQGDKPATWYNKVSGTTLKLWEKLEQYVALAKPGGQHRSTFRLDLPRTYMEGTTEKVGHIKYFITCQADEAVATDANLHDALVMVRDLVDEAVFLASHEDLIPSSM